MAFGAAVDPEPDDPSQDWLYDRGKVNRTLGFGVGEVQALLDSYQNPAPASQPASAPISAPPSPGSAAFGAGGTMSFGVGEVEAVLQGAGMSAPPVAAPAPPPAGGVSSMPGRPAARAVPPNRQTLQYDAQRVSTPTPSWQASAAAPVEDDPLPAPSPLPLLRRRGESVAPPLPTPSASAAPPPPSASAAPPAPRGARLDPQAYASMATPAIPLVALSSAGRPVDVPASVATPAPMSARSQITLPAPLTAEFDAPTRWPLGLAAGAGLVLGGGLWGAQSVGHGALFALTGALLVGLSWVQLRPSVRSVAMLVPSLPTLALASLATPSLTRFGAALATAWLATLTAGLSLRTTSELLGRRLIVVGTALGGLWTLTEALPGLVSGPASLRVAAVLVLPVLALAVAVWRGVSLRGFERWALAAPAVWAALLGLALGLDGHGAAVVLGQALCLGVLPGVVGASLAAVLTVYWPTEP